MLTRRPSSLCGHTAGTGLCSHPARFVVCLMTSCALDARNPTRLEGHITGVCLSSRAAKVEWQREHLAVETTLTSDVGLVMRVPRHELVGHVRSPATLKVKRCSSFTRVMLKPLAHSVPCVVAPPSVGGIITHSCRITPREGILQGFSGAGPLGPHTIP